MKLRHAFQGCLVAAMVTLGANIGSERAVAAPQDQPVAEQGIQVLTRGPVHAAFAETVTFDPQPGIVVSKAPPEAIEELPPDQKPEGANVAWIPGYWAWDDDRDDFLWVSGIWRLLPPNRQWVPGYWGQSGQNIQWTSGYWADAKQGDVRYLPEPPATVEEGPNIAAPTPDHVWIPGCWMWHQSRYAWRPGYWVTAQENWVWVPSHYHWSPRGYVFVDGYYDYSVGSRGVLFAPVYFDRSVYARRGFTYSPAFAISLAVFGNQLFLRPNYNHYYFGDYYGSNYSSGGFYPWFSFASGGYGYDPFYAQQRWQNRQNATWSQTVQADFQNRVDNEDARPARTLADQQALLKSSDTASAKTLVVATSLDQLAKSKDSSLKLQPVTKAEQQTLAKQGQEVRQFGEARQKLETKSAASIEKLAQGSEPATAKLPKSPITAKSPEQLGKDNTPPKAHEAPMPDSKVEPKPRRNGVASNSPKVEPKGPKANPKPDQPNVKPKSPTVEPKSTPKAGPKPAPKAEPKRESPKPQSKVEPKPDSPKPQPKAEPKPDSPRPEHKVEPKDKPKK